MKTRSQTKKEENFTEYKREYPTPYEAALQQEANKSHARRRKDRRDKAAAASKIETVYVRKPHQPDVVLLGNTETKTKPSFTDEVKEGKIVMHSSDKAGMDKALVAAELATVDLELAKIKEDNNREVELSVLPTYTTLSEICEAAKNRDLGRHGKDDVSELHKERRDKLFLVDAIRYHLDNGTFALNAQNQIAAEIEKRDILMGAMSLVEREIKSTYRFFSPDWSVVHKMYKPSLQLFNETQKKHGLITFANYFLKNDLANYKDKPIAFYTPEVIRKEMMEKFGIKEEELFKQPEKAPSQKNEVRPGFSWLGFMSKPVVAPEEKEDMAGPSAGLKS